MGICTMPGPCATRVVVAVGLAVKVGVMVAVREAVAVALGGTGVLVGVRVAA